MWIKPLLIVGVLTLSSSSGECYKYHEDPINAQETMLVLLSSLFFFCVLVLIDIFNYMSDLCMLWETNQFDHDFELTGIDLLLSRSPKYIVHQTKLKVLFISLHKFISWVNWKYFVAVVGSHPYVEVSFPGDMETCTLDKIVQSWVTVTSQCW